VGHAKPLWLRGHPGYEENSPTMKASRLAANLQGKQIGKWNVIKREERAPNQTGGHFSYGYIAEDEEGVEHFLKALNFFDIFNETGGNLTVLEALLRDYRFESDLLTRCKERKMRNVVVAIDKGEYREAEELLPVPYLVFEKAEGDLRSHKCMGHFDLMVRLGLFKECVQGVSQLHEAKIAHQDIKPSNVLVFNALVGKLADLGRATTPGANVPNSYDEHVGDLGYEPIELKYHYYSPDWQTRRFAADMFMLGDLLCFLTRDLSYLAEFYLRIDASHHPNVWGGTFSDALPYIVKAHSEILHDLKEGFPALVADRITAMIGYLCEPEPEKRGHPKTVAQTYARFSLERVISHVDLTIQQLRLSK